VGVVGMVGGRVPACGTQNMARAGGSTEHPPWLFANKPIIV
jgi:hypothetical protein